MKRTCCQIDCFLELRVFIIFACVFLSYNALSSLGHHKYQWKMLAAMRET